MKDENGMGQGAKSGEQGAERDLPGYEVSGRVWEEKVEEGGNPSDSR